MSAANIAVIGNIMEIIGSNILNREWKFESVRSANPSGQANGLHHTSPGQRPANGLGSNRAPQSAG